MNSAWLFAGGAAVTGLLATGWGYLRSFYQYIMSWLILSVTVQGYQSDALQLYLRERFKSSKFGPRLYTAWLLHVRPQQRTQLVSMEVIGSGGRLFWLGWRPLWVCKSDREDESMMESGLNTRDYGSNSLVLTFPRGFFDPDQLVFDASEYYNSRMIGSDERAPTQASRKRRHYVRHLSGSAGSRRAFATGSRRPQPSSSSDTRACMHHRPVGWSFDELGSEIPAGKSPLKDLALNQEAVKLVEEARFWKDNEGWYRGRGIPWRRGWLLHGPPGTGKTALIRSVAVELDLPVFIYDLASMQNQEMQDAWARMLSEVPCMAVIEDIDSVFHGRENVAVKEQQGLTFDCLLNCLDGIDRASGLFLAITTNHIERIDPALGRPTEGLASRPGRIDRILRLGELDELARTQIASRILFDRIDLQEQVIYEGEGDTAAQFQERCAQLALGQLWDDIARLQTSCPVPVVDRLAATSPRLPR